MNNSNGFNAGYSLKTLHMIGAGVAFQCLEMEDCVEGVIQ